MIVLVILLYAFLTYVEIVPLYKKKKWLDFWLSTCLTVLSFTIAVLLSFNVKIPSPSKPIGAFVTSIFGK